VCSPLLHRIERAVPRIVVRDSEIEFEGAGSAYVHALIGNLYVLVPVGIPVRLNHTVAAEEVTVIGLGDWTSFRRKPYLMDASSLIHLMQACEFKEGTDAAHET